jgi:dolichyl-phosphate beta-glucosyltransferase
MSSEESIVLSIVGPVYNETQRVKNLAVSFEHFAKEAMFSWELLFVDDGSSIPFQKDVLNEPFFINLHRSNRVKFLRDHLNLGKGSVIQRGVENCSGEYILTLDADLSALPHQAIAWAERMLLQSEPEVWVDSREHMSSNVHDLGRRRVAGRVFNFLIRALLPIKVNDTQCGFKLYPRAVAQAVVRDLKIKGWAHDVEIFLKLNRLNIPYRKMPLTVSSGSKISLLRDSWKMLYSVCYLFVLSRLGRLKKSMFTDLIRQ